ncbi:PDGFB factor, partial [Pseudoatta argentina]
MQSRIIGTSFDSQSPPYFIARMLVLAIVCGGFLLGQVDAQYHDDPDHIVFPGAVGSRSRDRALDNEPAGGSDDSDTIPLDLAARLNTIDSLEEFLQLLHGVPQNEKGITFARFFPGRFGGEERSNALIPMPAKCMPELQLVSLKLDDDPSTFVFPLCTRIKRCGGCCISPLLSCQPTATEMRNFEVIVTSLVDMDYRGRQIVPVEEHTKCKCDCKIKEEHCNDKQHYEPHNCKCACNNVDEEEKCRKNDTKIWNSTLCVCTCRTIEPCTTGYYFNPNTCRCGPIMLSRPVNRFAPMNYNFTDRRPENRRTVIIPLDPSDPRRKHKEDPEYK